MVCPSRHQLKGKQLVAQTVLSYEAVGFAIIILVIWTNKILDIPYHVLGAPPTRINWEEALFEPVCVSALGMIVLLTTRKFLRHIKYLEGFLVICAFCKKIRVHDDTWIPIEEFVLDRAEVVFSHPYCPECGTKHFGHYLGAKRESTRELRHQMQNTDPTSSLMSRDRPP